jgi:MFS family permease
VNSRLNVIIEIAQGVATVAGGIVAEYSFAWCYIISVFVALLALVPAVLFVEPEVEDRGVVDCLDDDNRVDNQEYACADVRRNVIDTVKDHFIVSVKVIRSDSNLRRILLYYPFVFTFHTIVFFYGQEFFSQLGMNKIEISIIMLFAGLISILGALSSEWFLSRFGHRAKFVASIMMGFGVLAMSRYHLVISILAFAVINYANSVLYPIQSAAINELIPSKQRATIISVNSMIFSVLMVLLFPICGLFADLTDLHLVFLMLGLFQLLIMVMIVRNKRKTKG